MSFTTIPLSSLSRSCPLLHASVVVPFFISAATNSTTITTIFTATDLRKLHCSGSASTPCSTTDLHLHAATTINARKNHGSTATTVRSPQNLHCSNTHLIPAPLRRKPPLCPLLETRANL